LNCKVTWICTLTVVMYLRFNWIRREYWE